MKHETIKTENYLLAVDDSEIKEGDWYYLPRTNSPHFCASKEASKELNLERSVGVKKILAHLPLEGQNLYGLDLLPPLEQEDDVEKLADKLSKEYSVYETAQDDVYQGIIIGYNKAKEKYNYTEEDMRKAILMAREDEHKIDVRHPIEIIQSLSQPKMPIWFECEMTFKQMPDFHKDEPKTTTNPQGQTVWVGKYIY